MFTKKVHKKKFTEKKLQTKKFTKKKCHQKTFFTKKNWSPNNCFHQKTFF